LPPTAVQHPQLHLRGRACTHGGCCRTCAYARTYTRTSAHPSDCASDCASNRSSDCASDCASNRACPSDCASDRPWLIGNENRPTGPESRTWDPALYMRRKNEKKAWKRNSRKFAGLPSAAYVRGRTGGRSWLAIPLSLEQRAGQTRRRGILLRVCPPTTAPRIGYRPSHRRSPRVMLRS
jgi:hypothetical protein